MKIRKEITMHTDKSNEPIDGVKCIVNTCHYHVMGDQCSATKIQIQPKNASSTEETDCGTFRPNDSSMK